MRKANSRRREKLVLDEGAGKVEVSMGRDAEVMRAHSGVEEKASGGGLLVTYKYELKDF